MSRQGKRGRRSAQGRHGPHGRRAEQGAVGGADILVLGFVVLLSGTLLVAHVWAVVDATFAAHSAAREATRAAVEAPGGSDLSAVALAAAAAAFDGHRAALDPVVEVDVADGAAGSEAGRCSRIAVTVRAAVPAVVFPALGDLLPVSVRATHSEVVDPFRDGLAGEARCAR